MTSLCKHGNVVGEGHYGHCFCHRCLQEVRDRDERARTFPARLKAALSRMREWQREVGGDYYPATERIAEAHDIDVWVLRDEWTAPFLKSYRARDEAKTKEANE